MKNKTIKEKRMMLEVLEGLMDRLEDERLYITRSYQKVGEVQVEKDGELVYNDDGTPKMRSEYDYVDIAIDDLSEDSKLKLSCVNKIASALEKMI